MNWQQTTLVEPPSAGGTNLDPRLRFEFGWAEVRSGLGLVLRGWLQIPLVLLFAVGVMVSIFSTKEDGGHQLSAESRLLAMELLMALVGLAILYSWACILSGYWRCLMHAPERHWTKWLMYGCILCVCGGPVIGTVLGTGSIPKQVKLQHGMEGFKQIELSMEALVLQGVAMAVNLLNFVLFILFLRAIAQLFQRLHPDPADGLLPLVLWRDRGSHAVLYLRQVAPGSAWLAYALLAWQLAAVFYRLSGARRPGPRQHHQGHVGVSFSAPLASPCFRCTPVSSA